MRKNFTALLKQTLSAPVFEDEEKTRRARLLNAIIWTFLAITLSGGLVLFTMEGFGIRLSMAITIFLGLGGVYSLLRRGYIQPASLVLVLVLSLSTTVTIYRLGGLRFPGASFFILITLIAGLLLDVWPALAVLGVLVLTIVALYYAEIAGYVVYNVANEPLPVVLIANLIILALTAVLIYLYTAQVKQALAQARRNEDALAERNLALQQEIIERAQAEAALRESRQMLQSIIDHIPQAVFWKDENLDYLGCNLKFAADAGLNLPAEIIGKNDYEMPWQHRANRYHVEDRQVMAEGNPKLNFEEEIINSKGEPIWLRTSLIPLRDDAGRVIGVLGIYENITPQKQIEKALRESEERYRTLVENAPVGIFITGNNFEYLYVNDEMCSLFGYPRHEMLGKDFRELLTPEMREMVANRYLRRQRGEAIPNRYEIEVIRQDGQQRRMDLTVALIKDSTGDTRTIGQILDITERARIEATLRRQTQQLETLRQISLELAAKLELNALLQSIVSRAAELLGGEQGGLFLYRPEYETLELVATSGSAGLPLGITIQPGEGHTGKVWRTGKPNIVGDYHQWAGKSTVLLSMTQSRSIVGVPIRFGDEMQGVLNVMSTTTHRFSNDDAELLSLFAAQAAVAIQNAQLHQQAQRHAGDLEQEVIERKRAEAALSESEQRYRILAEVSFEGIAMSDKGIIVDTNDQFNRMYGYTRSEVVNMEVWQFIAPESRDLVRGHILAGYEQPYEAVQLRKDGSVFIALVSGKSIPYKGHPVRVTIIQDITAMKQAEQALKEYSERLAEMVEARTKELQEAQEQLVRQEKLAFLGQLAGGVGHELRNPLGVITNAIYFLQMVLPDADERVKEYLNLIASRVDEAEKIVSDLLNLSRIKPTAKESVAVSTLVAETLRRHPPSEQVVVATNLASDLPAVFVDAQQIGQVLSNLVTNAYQSIPQGGQVTITAQANASEVKLSVIDTGVGMPPEAMAKIFEPLYTTKAKGIGLGLAVSKNLVEVNGGKIEVESVEGQGSIFSIILPIK
jgi:PAS domain S-box-containing protein